MGSRKTSFTCIENIGSSFLYHLVANQSISERQKFMSNTFPVADTNYLKCLSRVSATLYWTVGLTHVQVSELKLNHNIF